MVGEAEGALELHCSCRPSFRVFPFRYANGVLHRLSKHVDGLFSKCSVNLQQETEAYKSTKRQRESVAADSSHLDALDFNNSEYISRLQSQFQEHHVPTTTPLASSPFMPSLASLPTAASTTQPARDSTNSFLTSHVKD